MSHGNGQVGFKVIPVGTVKADLQRFHKELMLKGKGSEFLRILRKVYQRLRDDPRDFGELLYRLPALKLQVYQAVINPIVVTYGVHDELPIVFVQVVKLLS